MEIRKWNGKGILEASDHIVVGEYADGDEIEAEVIIQFDHSPAEPDVGMQEESFDVTSIRYLDGRQVYDKLITLDMIETWEEDAPGLAAEYLDSEKEAAAEARADARRDGDL